MATGVIHAVSLLGRPAPTRRLIALRPTQGAIDNFSLELSRIRGQVNVGVRGERIGKREGLKIPWGLAPCGFKSPPPVWTNG